MSKIDAIWIMWTQGNDNVLTYTTQVNGKYVSEEYL